MSKPCDYCENKTKLLSMFGERRCEQCLAELPTSSIEARRFIANQNKELLKIQKEATRLALWLNVTLHKNNVFEAENSTIGVLSQIDNMLNGAIKK